MDALRENARRTDAVLDVARAAPDPALRADGAGDLQGQDRHGREEDLVCYAVAASRSSFLFFPLFFHLLILHQQNTLKIPNPILFCIFDNCISLPIWRTGFHLRASGILRTEAVSLAASGCCVTHAKSPPSSTTVRIPSDCVPASNAWYLQIVFTFSNEKR